MHKFNNNNFDYNFSIRASCSQGKSQNRKKTN